VSAAAAGALDRLRDAWRGVHRQQGFVFEVTARCNHACDHCYNVWAGRGAGPPPGELDTAATCELLARMLDQTGARVVTLSGGEPLLRPDLFDLVDFLAGRGVATTLVTNGRLLGRDAVARLAGKVSVFELPLLSARREVHDAMSGAPGAFDRVTEAIADLKLAGQHVVGVFVATRRNLPDFAETAELAFALGVDALMLNRFNPGGRGRDHVDALLPDPEAVRGLLAVADAVAARLSLPIACSIAMPPCLVDTRPFTRLTFGFCAAGTERAYFTVDPRGDVRPCNHSPTVLGNVRERTFRSLARGRAMSTFAAALPAFCADCARRDVCRGCCKAAGEACSGSPRDLEPFVARHRALARKPA
jgi:radical SAM protein with 4Fe4S-binding SPASM domain